VETLFTIAWNTQLRRPSRHKQQRQGTQEEHIVIPGIHEKITIRRRVPHE